MKIKTQPKTLKNKIELLVLEQTNRDAFITKPLCGVLGALSNLTSRKLIQFGLREVYRDEEGGNILHSANIYHHISGTTIVAYRDDIFAFYGSSNAINLARKDIKKLAFKANGATLKEARDKIKEIYLP